MSENKFLTVFAIQQLESSRGQSQFNLFRKPWVTQRDFAHMNLERLRGILCTWKQGLYISDQSWSRVCVPTLCANSLSSWLGMRGKATSGRFPAGIRYLWGISQPLLPPAPKLRPCSLSCCTAVPLGCSSAEYTWLWVQQLPEGTMMCLDGGFVRGRISAHLLAEMLYFFFPAFLVPREGSLHSTETKKEIKMSPGWEVLGSGLPFLYVLPIPGVFGRWVPLLRRNWFFSKTNAAVIPHGRVGFKAFRLPSSSDGWGLWPSWFSPEELQTSLLAAMLRAFPTVYSHWDLWGVQPDREDWSGWEKTPALGTWMHSCS